jgi:hypothetical protein
MPNLSDDEALQLIDGCVNPNGFLPERTAQEESMLRSMAFFMGKQHFVQDGMLLRRPRSGSKHRVYYKANKILPAVVKAVSKIAQAGSTIMPAPSSDSPQALLKADLGKRIVEQAMKQAHHDRHRLIALMWAAICGTGFTKFSWDPDRGVRERFYFDSDGGGGRRLAQNLSPQQRRSYEEAGQFVDYAPGDIDAAALSPFAVFEDPNARDGGVEKARWMAHVQYLDREVAAETYEMDIEDVPVTADNIGSQVYEDAIAFMSTALGGRAFASNPSNKARRDRVRVVELYWRPSKKYPNGLKLVSVGGVIPKDGNRSNPFATLRNPELHLPFVKWDWVPCPGRWWGIGLAEQLTSSQFQYNKARSTMTEFQNVFGQPITFVPENSNIPTGNMPLEPGAIYGYNPAAGRIVPGPSPNLPKEVFANAEIAAREIQELSADSDPDTSKLPGQIRSGEGIRLMQEEKNQVLHPVVEGRQAAEERSSRFFLELGRKYYTEARMLRYRGEGGSWVVKMFTSADLSQDIEFVPDPNSLMSLVARNAEILDMVQVGVLAPQSDPNDRAAVFKSLKFNVGRDTINEKTEEAENQWSEIEQMYADPFTPVQVNSWDDHEAHERELRRHLRSDRFKRANRNVQEALVNHWTQHRQLYEQAIQANMQALAQTKGSAGVKGTASQPSR